MFENSNISYGDLIEGTKLKNHLELVIPKAQNKIVSISAYITASAVDWLIDLLPENSHLLVVCRILPSDVINGSTDLSALKNILSSSGSVYCLTSLHAKIYSVDNETIFVGSSNLTANGLKLYGTGNEEAVVMVEPKPSNINFIDSIIRESTQLDENILNQMEEYIKDKSLIDEFVDRWPDTIIDDKKGVWVPDFFFSEPYTNLNPETTKHDLNLIGIVSLDTDNCLIKKGLLNSKPIRWLKRTLDSASDQEMYFGELSNRLHNDLNDDPTPYRKTVKSLLSNTAAYCEAFLSEEISITRPNFSQKFKLLN